ncbi:MAG: hypothetical protein IJI01_10525 [Butyrivibrio sp.]|uniref:hypothetical protein n=1 Tax=Butyrivibrio sp. TaxID=28121 RepID=UPI0025BE2B5E|nr:hypothetical protein [Butyrivibrio sp.]MBQ6589101.1 hypothetical protein [Butyrivibrio sp.]
MKKCGILLIFVLSIIVNIYFGFQKSGFHEDEYYTYYSSNRTAGLYQPDREWQDRQTILDEFVVRPGEGFNYGLVKLVQSWDVHPPLYYMIFHTICSLVPGVFTKWTGVITNLIAFVLAFWVMHLIMKRLKTPCWLEAIALLFYGVNPQTISSNMLIRMYAWLSLWVALCAYFHIRLIQDYSLYGDKANTGKRDMKSALRAYASYMLPVMVTSYLGFLTQYFYIFFFVSIGIAFTAWLIFWKKNVRYGLIYVASCAISLGLAVITYPASIHHMLGGYRGNEAAGSLFDIGNTIMRLSFFAGLLNDFVFAGLFILVLEAILIGLGIRIYQKKTIAFTPDLVILIIGTIGYFLITSKTALLVGAASNRYEMPCYGLIILITVILLQRIWRFEDAQGKENSVVPIIAGVLASVFVLVILVKGICIDNRVLFLYPEDTAKIQYAADNHDQVAVVMFNPATPHNIWRLTDELLQYDKVFYMDVENSNNIEDSEIVNASKIILYVADDDYQDKAITDLKEATRKTQIMPLFTEDMWNSYELE